jgi:hypothetical protein
MVRLWRGRWKGGGDGGASSCCSWPHRSPILRVEIGE